MEFVTTDEPHPESLLQSNELQNELLPQRDDLSDDILIPKTGMVFKSREEVYTFYLEYSHKVGFGIMKTSMKNDDDGNLKYYSVGCSRGGKGRSKVKNALNPRPSRKTTCKAKINAILTDKGEFMISKVNLEHNHALSPEKTRFFKCNKKIDSYVKRRLETNDQAGIRLSNNFHSLAMEVGGYENLSFTEKDCRNHIQKVRQIRLGVGDAASLNNYFACMQKRNPNFYYVLDMDDDGRLKNVFWADARSIAAYETFGDVISFDTTYLTNKYDMPFAPFVGVNHHGQTILFGCGLLSNEEAETYVWLFSIWLKCMSKPPNAIITDQCKSIQKAVKTVFPDSHYRLCLWHIMKKLPEKLGTLRDYEQIKTVLKSVVYESIEIQEFEEIWAKMIVDFDLRNNTWLSGLYEDRYRWVPVFVKGFFWAGMSTTQRSENMNAFFDGYVNRRTSLKQFVEQYDNALKSKIEKEIKADFDSFSSQIPVITVFEFEKQLQGIYTNELFRLFQDELRGLGYCNLEFLERYESISTYKVIDILSRQDGAFIKEVTYVVSCDEMELEFKCSCRLFEFKGIICRHIVKVLIRLKVKFIPSQYILYRWRKDVKHKHSYVKNCYDDVNSEYRERYTCLNSKCSKAIEIGVESVEKFQFLMRCLNDATSKLIDDSSWSKQSAEDTLTTSTTMIEDYQTRQPILSPTKVPTKGHPSSKRKMSFLEHKMNKKKSVGARKNKQKNQLSNQESQLGPSELSTTMNQFETEENLVKNDQRVLEEEDLDENEEALCGVCGDSEASNEFWIGCDICDKWFHGKCVMITPARAEYIKKYKCPDCNSKRLPH